MAPKRYKIAVVIPKYGLVGGGEKFARELTERIALNDHYDVHVFANKWESRSDRVTFHTIPIISFPKFLTTVSFAWFANRAIAKMDFDLVHTHDRIFRADIFTMHGVPHRFWVRKVRKKVSSLFDCATIRVEKSLIKHGNCRAFLPVSTITKNRFLQEFDVDPAKVHVIHPGVDIERFSALDRNLCRGEIRKRFDIDENDIVFLFVSMNFELKGLKNLMTAMAMAKSEHPSHRIKLLIVGKGNSKKYRRLAKRLGIRNDVMFTGIWKDNIEHIYMASDILAIPSGFDTFGMVVLEAMSASLPVIVSDNVGAKDLVRDGINGFVVDNQNVDLICSSIVSMLNEEKRADMAKAAYRTAINNTWDVTTDKVLKIYDEMTGN